MSFEEVEEVAKGRIWTGPKALELNLVDEIGNLEDAIQIAANKIGIEDYTIKEYPNIESPAWAEFISGFTTEASILESLKENPVSAEIMALKEKLKSYTETKAPLVLMPIKIDF